MNTFHQYFTKIYHDPYVTMTFWVVGTQAAMVLVWTELCHDSTDVTGRIEWHTSCAIRPTPPDRDYCLYVNGPCWHEYSQDIFHRDWQSVVIHRPDFRYIFDQLRKQLAKYEQACQARMQHVMTTKEESGA